MIVRRILAGDLQRATAEQQVLIADTLVVEAHKDILAKGLNRELIWVRGPTGSPSARYCRRYLNMTEEASGGVSNFWHAFMQIVDGPHSRKVS